MISREIDIDSGCTIIADAVDDYINERLTLNSMCVLLKEFAIMGNNCSQKEVDDWNDLYNKLKERDNI